MQRAFFIGFLLAVANGSVLATQKDPGETEIRAVMNTQVAAGNRGDIDKLMDGYVRSDKLEFVSGGKIPRGWQTVRDRYHRKYGSRSKMGTLRFTDIKLNWLNANVAVVTGRWSLRRKIDQPHGSFVLTFKHTPAGWRIVHDQTS